MSWDLMNIALIGLAIGIFAQFFMVKDSMGRTPGVLLTVVPSILGALMGGIAAWFLWPVVKEAEGQFQLAGFAAAIVGSLLVVVPTLAVIRRMDKYS